MPRLLILGFLLAAPLTVMSADSEAGRVKSITCTGCHGIPGYKNTYPTYTVPKIAGQNAAYIELALKAYRDGQRTHGTMNNQAQGLSDEDISDIAAYFESLVDLEESS